MRRDCQVSLRSCKVSCRDANGVKHEADCTKVHNTAIEFEYSPESDHLLSNGAGFAFDARWMRAGSTRTRLEAKALRRVARRPCSASGCRRSFNKKSVQNWGTPQAPAPTLGLEPDQNANCIGTAFEFP